MAALTALNEDLDTSETGADITPSLTAATRPSKILIDDEVLSVSAGTSSLTVGRGAEGSTPAAHANSAPVYEVSRVVSRGDSLLIYYIDANGMTALKKISAADDPATEGYPYVKDISITETAAAGVYTGLVAVRAGTRLLDILVCNTAAFASTAATLKVGLVGTDNAFITGYDVKAANVTGNSNAAVGAGWGTTNAGILSGAKAGYLFANDDTINVTVTCTGSGGTTGRLRVSLLLVRSLTALAATKV